MAKIYISHSKSDFELARKISAKLVDIGHELWSDENLKAGSDWHAELQENLANADAVVVLVTEQSVNSQYVMSEVGAMLAYSRERGRGGVIPVWFDEVQLPTVLQSIQAIPANRNNLDELVIQISRAVERIVGVTLAKDEKRKERRELLERVASDFIDKSQSNLLQRERSYKNQANAWYIGCCTVLTVGAALSLWRVSAVDYNSSNLYSLLEVLILGAISCGLILGIAKFSFTLGKSYMVEALRNADRSHAISFGEFYLKSYGSESDWNELKEAFQHWNIDTGSVFNAQKTADFDPKILETALALARVISEAPKSKK